MLKRVGVVLAVAIASFVVLSSGSDAEATRATGPVGTYVGTLRNSDAFVAVMVGQQAVSVWFCDNGTIAVQFLAPRKGNAFDLRLQPNVRVTGRVTSREVTGSLRFGSTKARSYRAGVTKGMGGLYRATTTVGGAETRVAWVVRDDGKMRGSVFTPTSVRPAPLLDVAGRTASLDGTPLVVSRSEPTPFTTGAIQFGGGFAGFQFGQGSLQFGGLQGGFQGAVQFGGFQGGFQTGTGSQLGSGFQGG